MCAAQKCAHKYCLTVWIVLQHGSSAPSAGWQAAAHSVTSVAGKWGTKQENVPQSSYFLFLDIRHNCTFSVYICVHIIFVFCHHYRCMRCVYRAESDWMQGLIFWLDCFRFCQHQRQEHAGQTWQRGGGDYRGLRKGCVCDGRTGVRGWSLRTSASPRVLQVCVLCLCLCVNESESGRDTHQRSMLESSWSVCSC